MVRVGGGWVALDEFLVKNDPCRGTFLLAYLGTYLIADHYLLFPNVSRCKNEQSVVDTLKISGVTFTTYLP